MRTYDNPGINRMNISIPVTVFCPLGPNYYRAELSCEISLTDKIVDFHDLEDYFKKELNGKELTSENLVCEVFNKLDELYKPMHLKVSSKSDSHFAIEVIKEK